jgi:hypothetical protein
MMNGMTKRMGLVPIGIVLLLTTGACYEHTFTVGGGAPHGQMIYDHWQNYWLDGLIGHTKVDLEEICPSGRATIVAKQTFLNGLVAGLTGGIYTPTTLQIQCADGRRADVALDAEDVEAIVSDPAFLQWVGEEMPERVDEVAAARAALAER